MVSWQLHRLLGDDICCFHSTEIDRLIDQANGHDSSRYNVSEFERIFRVVKSKYGNKGICYLILHHYLDRLVDILVSKLTDYYELYALGYRELNEAYEKMREEVYTRLYYDPKNILSLLVTDLQTLLNTLHSTYSGRSRRRQRNRYKELLEKAYREIHNNNVLYETRSTVNFILNALHQSVDCILYTVLLDETFRSSPLDRMGNVLQVKIARYIYRGFTELAEKLLSEDRIYRFLSYMLDRAREGCQESQNATVIHENCEFFD